MGNESSTESTQPTFTAPTPVVVPITLKKGDLISYQTDDRYLAEVMEIDEKDSRVSIRYVRMNPEEPFWVQWPSTLIGKADYSNTVNKAYQDRDNAARASAAQSNIQCRCDPGFQCICHLLARPPVPE